MPIVRFLKDLAIWTEVGGVELREHLVPGYI